MFSIVHPIVYYFSV